MPRRCPVLFTSLRSVTPMLPPTTDRYLSNQSVPNCWKKISTVTFWITLPAMTAHQFGFLPKSSTSDALITALHDWYGSIEDKKSIVMALFDLFKAFDHVSHHPLLWKLGAVGLTVQFSPGSNTICPSWFLCTVLTLTLTLLFLVFRKALSLDLCFFLSMSMIFASLTFLQIAL